MKLSEYIKGLQEFLAKHGDLECFYSADDEGNNYQKVYYTGSLLHTMNPEAYCPDMYCEEDLAEYEDEEFVRVCIIN